MILAPVAIVVVGALALPGGEISSRFSAIGFTI